MRDSGFLCLVVFDLNLYFLLHSKMYSCILPIVLVVFVGQCHCANLVTRSLEEVDHPLAHYQDLYQRDEQERVDLREGLSKFPGKLPSFLHFLAVV